MLPRKESEELLYKMLMASVENVEVCNLWNPTTSTVLRLMRMIIINLSNFKLEKMTYGTVVETWPSQS